MSRTRKAATESAATATPPRHLSGMQKFLLAGAVGLELLWIAALAVLACL